MESLEDGSVRLTENREIGMASTILKVADAVPSFGVEGAYDPQRSAQRQLATRLDDALSHHYDHTLLRPDEIEALNDAAKTIEALAFFSRQFLPQTTAVTSS